MLGKLSTIALIAVTFAVTEIAVSSSADAYVRVHRGGAYHVGVYRGGVYRGGVYRGGVYRGGVYRGGAVVVGRPYYGGVWYGTGRRYWGGRWWPYGVGSCWRPSPIGYVWIC
jgi:hypothetical protein